MRITNEKITYDHTFNGLVLGFDIRWSLKTNVESTGFTRSSDSPDFWIEIPPTDRFKEVYSTAHGPVEFHEGKLIMQVRDGNSKNLIWEGVAKVLMSEKYTPKEIENGIQEATAELLKGFPPDQ